VLFKLGVRLDVPRGTFLRNTGNSGNDGIEGSIFSPGFSLIFVYPAGFGLLVTGYWLPVIS
jgi:hypothetical protein